MQLFSAVYIVLLHMILNGFSDEAVAAPGLYCKAQSFFIPPVRASDLYHLFFRIDFDYARLSFPVSKIISGTISGTIGPILYFREPGRRKRDPSLARGVPAAIDCQPGGKF